MLFLPSLSDFEFVNAQPNVDLYMNLHFLKGHFSQQMRGYTGHLTDLLDPTAGK